MKTAQTANGQPIQASNSAPKKAICPSCGDIVTLRHRKRMNNEGTSYFWRHRQNRSRRCSARVNPTTLFK